MLDLISFSFQTNFNFEIISFSNVFGAIEFFESGAEFSLVVIDYKIGKQVFSNMLKGVVDSKNKVPVFALGAPKKAIESMDNSDLVEAIINKENLLQDLSRQVQNFFVEDTSEKPKEFCEVKFSVLTVFEGIESDVYIQLISGRYLKIFSEGDDVREDDVKRYAKKGVHSLYLKKAICNWLLKSINKNIEKIVDAIETNEEIKISPEPPRPTDASSTNESEDIDKRIEDVFLFDKQMERDVNEKIKKTMSCIRKVPTLAKFLKKVDVNRNKDNYYKVHVNLLCKILTALCHLLEWRQSSTIEKLIFVAYMHDISLAGYPHLAKLQTIDDLNSISDDISDEEREMFLRHPEEISELVKKMSEAPVDADIIILQHHERSDGSGFPFGHKSSRLLPMSALFIISHDLVNYILKTPKWSMPEFVEQSRENYSGANFNKIMRKISELKF